MLLQLLPWLGISAYILPCDSQTDFAIKRFEFFDNNITFVRQQTKEIKIRLEIEIPITKAVTTNFESKFYLNNTLGKKYDQQAVENEEEVLVPDVGETSRVLQLFRFKNEDKIKVTLPDDANCTVPYSFCVEVRESSKQATKCLHNSRYNFTISCADIAVGLPFYETDAFLAVIIGVAVILVFILAVCCVLIRFREKVAKFGRRHMFSKSPEEAYNIIRKRLAVKSFHDEKPYVIDPETHRPVIIADKRKSRGVDRDDYAHLNRFTGTREPNTSVYESEIDINNEQSSQLHPYTEMQDILPQEKLDKNTNIGGEDNPTFDQTTPELHPYEDTMNKHPYEDNLSTPTHHYEDDLQQKNPYEQNLGSHPYEGDCVQSNPYEDKIQETSGGRGSISSGSQIHVSIENERNLRKDSETSKQNSSSEPDTNQTGSGDSYLQQSVSGGSYISALSARERDRSKSINPLKPDVDFEGFSDASMSGGSEPRMSIDYLGEPPPLPRTLASPHNEDKFDGKPAHEAPPLLHPRPSKPKPPPPAKPKPKSKKLPPVPIKPRKSKSGDEPMQIPSQEKKDKNTHNPLYSSRINITGGGSTKTPADFRRPSLFRTPSQEQIFPNPHQQNIKQLPDVYMSAIEGTQKSFPKISATGTLKRSHAQFATMALENFLALVEEIEHPMEDDEIPEADTSYETATQERPSRGPIRRPLSVRRNSTPLLLDSTDKRQSTMSGYSESSYVSDMSDIYVNKWNKEWEIGRRDLNVDRAKPLGEGQFGKVYKGVASYIAGRPGDTMVAIKELKDGAKIEDKDEFLKELAIHTLIEPHENVIELLGCCIRDEPLCIILEFMHNGSLLRYLRKQKKNEQLAQYLTVRFGYQCALGMNHVANMGIVHRDLAARNILVSDQLVCKVSDFGFARDVFGVKSYNKAPEKAPIRWYAPEAILDDTFTTKTDVWSFGIMLFEIITMGYVLPYHRDPSTASVRLTIATGGVPPKPPYCNDELYEVMKLCWHRDPEKRPEFVELARILDDFQDKYEPPSPYGESDA